MNNRNLKFTIKIKSVRNNRCANPNGFNGYGKYRSSSNLPYGYLNKYQKKAGIYYIKNKITNMIYIGSSNNIGSRISKHFSQLKKQNHPNKLLVADYNKYGINSFDFGVFEFTNNDLLIKEKNYQLQYDKNILYNLQIKDTYRSDAQRLAMKTQDKTSFKTIEFRNKIRKLKQNKIGQFDKVTGNLICIFNNSDEVCAKYPIAKSTLLGACNGSKKSAGGYLWKYLDSNNNIIAEGKGKTRTILQRNEDIV